MMECKKVSFANEEVALYYIDKLQKTSKRKVIPNRAYLCEKCLNWHLTSSQNRKSIEDEALSIKIGKLNNKVKQFQKESENKSKKIAKLHDEIYSLNRRLKRTSNNNSDYDWKEAKKYVDDPSKSWDKRYKLLENHHIKEMHYLNKKDDN